MNITIKRCCHTFSFVNNSQMEGIVLIRNIDLYV